MTPETQLVVELLRLGTHLVRTGTRLVAQHGISQQQFVILKAAEERGPVSQKEVCSAFVYERSNVSKAVRQLSAKGLLTKARSPADGRVTLLEITPAGREIVAACMPAFERWNQAWAGQLDAGELARAVALLRKLDVNGARDAV